MPNKPQPSSGSFSEFSNERSIQHAERETLSTNVTEEQFFIDYLLDEGFVLKEATKLLHLRDHLHENAEMRQRMDNDYRMHFVKWLYEQGEISEQ